MVIAGSLGIFELMAYCSGISDTVPESFHGCSVREIPGHCVSFISPSHRCHDARLPSPTLQCSQVPKFPTVGCTVTDKRILFQLCADSNVRRTRYKKIVPSVCFSGSSHLMVLRSTGCPKEASLPAEVFTSVTLFLSPWTSHIAIRAVSFQVRCSDFPTIVVCISILSGG